MKQGHRIRQILHATPRLRLTPRALPVSSPVSSPSKSPQLFTIDTRLEWLKGRYARGEISTQELEVETTRLLQIYYENEET